MGGGARCVCGAGWAPQRTVAEGTIRRLCVITRLSRPAGAVAGQRLVRDKADTDTRAAWLADATARHLDADTLGAPDAAGSHLGLGRIENVEEAAVADSGLPCKREAHIIFGLAKRWHTWAVRAWSWEVDHLRVLRRGREMRGMCCQLNFARDAMQQVWNTAKLLFCVGTAWFLHCLEDPSPPWRSTSAPGGCWEGRANRWCQPSQAVVCIGRPPWRRRSWHSKSLTGMQASCRGTRPGRRARTPGCRRWPCCRCPPQQGCGNQHQRRHQTAGHTAGSCGKKGPSAARTSGPWRTSLQNGLRDLQCSKGRPLCRSPAKTQS